MAMTSPPRAAPDVGAQMRLDDDGGIPVPDPVAGESAHNATAQEPNPPSTTGGTVPARPNRPAGKPPEPAPDQRHTSVGGVVHIDAALKRRAFGRRRWSSRPTAAGRPPERAQLVWGRALELAEPGPQHDRFADALALLRAAHHDPATMAHALTLGRTHLRAHAGDALARGGVRLLEATIAFLGVKPRTGDLARAQR